MKNSIDEFAGILIREVRDAAISACEARLDPQATSPVAMRWKKSNVDDESVRMLAADAVDQTLFYLLDAIDNGILRMKFISESAEEIDLTKESRGEFAGWYMGPGGWIETFSAKQAFDPRSESMKPMKPGQLDKSD
jgi:hypothetical protein